jgi:hypothetical protein
MKVEVVISLPISSSYGPEAHYRHGRVAMEALIISQPVTGISSIKVVLSDVCQQLVQGEIFS